MQPQNPFSTSHLWNANQNKGPKHYNDFMEAQQRLDEQRLAYSENTMQDQLMSSSVLPGRFTDIRPESPAMAARRNNNQKRLSGYDTTGRELSKNELEEFAEKESAWMKKLGRDPINYIF